MPGRKSHAISEKQLGEETQRVVLRGQAPRVRVNWIAVVENDIAEVHLVIANEGGHGQLPRMAMETSLRSDHSVSSVFPSLAPRAASIAWCRDARPVMWPIAGETLVIAGGYVSCAATSGVLHDLNPHGHGFMAATTPPSDRGRIHTVVRQTLPRRGARRLEGGESHALARGRSGRIRVNPLVGVHLRHALRTSSAPIEVLDPRIRWCSVWRSTTCGVRQSGRRFTSQV